MKFVFLAVALGGLFPFSFWLRSNRRHTTKFWVLVGFLPFGLSVIPHSFIAIISWPTWSGFAKGVEISLLDLLLLALYIGLPKGQTSLPFKTSMTFYLLAVLFSAFFAMSPVASSFYLWQLARMYFAYVVVARASADERVIGSLLTGMLLGLSFEACIVIWQRFVMGNVQTAGTLSHQNTLGMISHFVVFPLFALFLAGRKGWQPLTAPIAGITIAILTVSRATIGLAGLAYFSLFFLSAIRRWTARLATIAIVGVVSLLVIAPLVLSSFERRFAQGPLSNSYDERAAFEKAAEMMLSDHPLGVGANNFVVVANSKGYFDRAGVVAAFENRAAHVHNAYLLAAAETGYLGVIAFVFLLIQPLFLAFRVGWRNRKDSRGDLLLGLGVALLCVYLQSLYEWTFFLFYTQYIFAITIGMVAGLTNQLGQRRPLSTPLREPGAEVWLTTRAKLQH